MVKWQIRADMDEIDLNAAYGAYLAVFSIKLHYSGSSRSFLSLDCVEEGKLLYYHFKKPFSNLDIGLYALASDRDIHHLSTFIGNHKLIDVYTKHGKIMLHTHFVSPNPNKNRIQ
uniref:Uncharacterized protein n=1 Tax=Lactuca sativa TaxID=4236 RepID=A0A9R1WTF2_LACSA|nr:hypothetical protein LSAT_V11C100044140 [Lactuca sativa]